MATADPPSFVIEEQVLEVQTWDEEREVGSPYLNTKKKKENMEVKKSSLSPSKTLVFGLLAEKETQASWKTKKKVTKNIEV